MELQVLLRQIWTTDNAPATSAPGWQLAPNASTQPTDAPAPAQPIVLSFSEEQRLANGCVLLPSELWRTGLQTLGEATQLQDSYKVQNYIVRTGYQPGIGFYVAAPGSDLGKREDY